MADDALPNTPASVAHYSASRSSASRISPRARVGLDAARAFAAVYVVVYHIVSTLHLPRLVAIPFSFGQEAVLIFFLLSGFVIFASEQGRPFRLWSYYLRRLRRIYPLLLVAMLTSTVLWICGLIPATPSWESAFGTLLSIQDVSFLKPGVVTDPYLANDPLWSLSYEMFFYLVFPFALLLWRRLGRWTTHLIGTVAGAAYVTYALAPNHLSLVIAYFLVWWCGAMAARAALAGPMSVYLLRSEILWLSGLVLLSGVVVVLFGFNGIGYYPALMLRHFSIAVVMLLLLASSARRTLANAAAVVARPAVAVASISYGIYVLHFPVVIQTGSTGSAWVVPSLVVTVALAILAERGLMRLIPAVRR